ncbi:hypothetical protein ACHAXR_006469 [Thalassiosira sp. AJA248-18]
MTTPPTSRRLPARPLTCLLIATITDLSLSYAPSNNNAPLRVHHRVRTSSTFLTARRLPGGSSGGMRKANNWEDDDLPPSRNNAELAGDKAVVKPAWQENIEYWAEREALEELNKNAGGSAKKETSYGNTVGYNDGGNTFAHMYQRKSTDDFKKPYCEDNYDGEEESVSSLPPAPPRRVDSKTLPPHTSKDHDDQTPAWFGSNTRVSDGQKLPPQSSSQVSNANQLHGSMPPGISAGQQRPPMPQVRTFNPNANRHSFQTSSTDDFKKPHGMPSGMDQRQQQQRPAPPRVFKSPFQTSSTDDFKRSHDSMSGMNAPQQPLYQKPNRSDNPDSYESTQLPKQPPTVNNRGGIPPLQNPVDHQAQNTFQSRQKPPNLFTDAMIVDDCSQSTATPDAPMADFQDQKFETAISKSNNMMIRNVQWPLMRDPQGDCLEFPGLVTRIMVTMLATLSTRYLHLIGGFSPVLASSAITLLVSTCLDRRLGQAALCGSFAGMSGGHLVPNLPMAMSLAAVTSACYEILIRINNLCFGIGGRIGATAFLATSIMAKYQGIGSVGRKLRRGLWQSGSGLSSIALTMILYHVLGSLATIFLREASVDSAAADPVRASSVVGLLGSLFLKDPMAILAVYGGSFVGMSLPSQLINGNTPVNARGGKPQTAISLLTSFAGTGAMAGLIHAISIHWGYWNGGWGGKAGLCAFAACWVYRGFGNVVQFVKQRT